MKFFWHTSPFVRLAIPFAAGVYLGLGYVASSAEVLYVCFAFCVVVLAALFTLGAFWRKREFTQYFGIGLTVLFLVLGFLYTQTKNRSNRWNIPNATVYSAVVASVPQAKAKSIAVSLNVLSWQDSSGLVRHHPMKLMAYFAMDSAVWQMEPGDHIAFRGRVRRLKPPTNPMQFDYGRYLRQQGVSGTVYISQGDFTRSGSPSNFFYYVVQRWRARLVKLWKSYGFDDRENGVAAALILGERSEIDEGLRDKFAGAGAVHILAVSGLHVGIIYLFAATVLGFLFRGRKAKWFGFVMVLLVLWFYAAITGFSPSVLRAATMFSFIAIGKFYKRHLSIYNMIFASAFFLLMINPYLLSHVGFQLSYLAVLGIVWLYPIFYPMVNAPNWLLDKAWSLVVVSFAAQLATFPLSVHYFHQFPTYFPVANLLVIPLAWFILHAGILWLLTFYVPWVGHFFAYLVNGGAWVLNDAIGMVTSWPGAVVPNLYFAAGTCVLIYVCMTSLLAAFLRPGRVRFRVFYATFFGLLAIYAYRSVQRSTQEIIFFPAGSPEPAVVVVSGRHAVIYVDGNKEQTRERLAYLSEGYLCSRGVRDVSWSAFPRCHHPEICTSHPVHALDFRDTAWTRSAGDGVLYINDEKVLKEVLAGSRTTALVIGDGARSPRELTDTIQAEYGIRMLAEGGAQLMGTVGGCPGCARP